VGDRYVIDQMLQGGYRLGGEQSGHVIFRDFATTGDGLVSALQVLRIMKARNALLSQLTICWRRFPQKLVNLRVREKPPFGQVPGLTDLLAQAEAELNPDGGRVFLRYSGTEPKVRLLLEGREESVLEKWSRQIAEVIRRELGA
jgi:phosphoglucosamine mutase